ncbi:hypothetical protein D5H75_15220 [Bailinhaonella thermotolerans]|uniref:Uncharacterized protein n=1 Tax=Bailinhaonella thermotolerans TaxID=1070861 RepID=A0A3A4AZ58_9ACTN|nr:hypothetical protein D5H75_15220 [Bailinhaonella thermotolerans]
MLLRVGAVIAISGMVLTVVVDAYLRIEQAVERQREREAGLLETQRRLADVLASLKALGDASPACHDFLVGVAEDWRRAEERNSVFMLWILEDQQREFRARLRNLAEGRTTMDRRTERAFRSSGLADFVEMHVLSATHVEYWRTPPGRRYLRIQKDAQRTGLRVRRVLVLPPGDAARWADVVADQLAAGIELSLILAEEIPAEYDWFLRKDRALLTDRGGVTGVFLPSSSAEQPPAAYEGFFTTEIQQVLETRHILETLAAYEHAPSELYPAA